MHLPLIIASQGDPRTRLQIKRALSAAFPNGIPESIRVASPYALIYSLKDDQNRLCAVRVDFDPLFDFFAEEHPTCLGTFTTRNTKLLQRIAHLTFQYLRALHTRSDGSMVYACAEIEESVNP